MIKSNSNYNKQSNYKKQIDIKPRKIGEKRDPSSRI